MSDSGPVPGGADRPRFVPFSLRGGQFGSAERSRGRERDACLEVDCLRHRLPLEVIERAEERARALGIGADEVLIAAGEISEEVYCRSLAFALRLRFAELAALPRSACPLDDEALMPAARSDILALAGENGDVIMAVVPRGLAARALVRFVSVRPELRERIRLTTRANIQSFVRTHCNDLIGHHAAEQLRARNPKLSAAPRRRSRGAALLVAAGIIGSMAAAPYTTAVVLQVALTAVFLAAALLRLYGALRHPGDPSSAAGREDMPLPRYTVIAALYDEVEALPGLIAALAALDYPPEKLEIKLVLEADDAWTQLAAEALRGKGRFEVVLAPPGGPRTKPKALNYVLPFAAGDLVVVYDAEDRPEPDQLRRAAQAFAAGDGRLACVQARLTIDNTNDSWLTRLFTAEYAGLFDVLLPGLASLHLPIPLGGSSNHFRAAALRAAGAWDPYNVTEDADVGIRLARYGYITGIIASTTYEEAPGRLKPWLSQRTRWFKGWMQTLIVHMREPARLWREVGPAGIAGFYLVLGGTLLAALVQPLAICWLGWVLLAGGSLVPAGSGSALAALGWVHLATLIGGYGTAAMLALMGLKRRRLLRLTWIFAALPALWLLLSVAAWRALFQLVSRPQLWEKTPHGRARTSRRSEALRA